MNDSGRGQPLRTRVHDVFALYHGKARRVDLATLNALCRTLETGVGELFEYVPEESAE